MSSLAKARYNFRSSGRAGSAVPRFLSVAARRSPRRWASETERQTREE